MEILVINGAIIINESRERMSILKKILKNKAMKNGIWLYLMQIFNTVIPLLTLPYITRILGAGQYGIFSIAINLLGYFQVIVEYGFGMSATRKVALSEKKDRQLNKIFTTVLVSRIFLFVICCIITGVYFIINKSNIAEKLCLIILMIALLGNCIQLNWLFQGMQQMQFISIISIVSRTISVILTFVFVNSAEDLFLYCLLYSAAPFINGVLGIVIAKKQYNLCISKISIYDVLLELKEGWYVFTTQLSSKVFGAIGITFLGIYASNAEVGIYSAINKLPNMIILAWVPIAQVMYPISSKKMKDSFENGTKFVKKMQIIILPLAIIGVTIVSVFSNPIIKIAFGKEYASYSYWVIPLLIWLIVSINNNFWGIQTLLASGHDKEYSKCFQIGVVCTIFFNLSLIYFFGGNGACIAPLLSESILGLLLFKEINKIKKEMLRS